MSGYFNQVLTVCHECKKEITVAASYEERNFNYYCDECKNTSQERQNGGQDE